MRKLRTREPSARNYPVRTMFTRFVVIPILLAVGAAPILAVPGPPSEDNAAAIMAKVAENVDKATDTRRLYVYHQFVTSSLVRANGQMSRKEKREYQVFPGEKSTEKKLVSLNGQCFRGKEVVPYTEAGFHYKGTDLDGDLIEI